jgi:hypothetical protein
MERNGRPRRRPEAPSAPPTTITELARRYHSCAVALSRSLGIPMSETFVLEFHNAISSIFIAADRAGVRLPPAVQLPPLAEAPVAERLRREAETRANAGIHGGGEGAGSAESPVNPGSEETLLNASQDKNGDPPPLSVITRVADLPTRIPAGLQLPCAEALITDLRPPQLSLLIGKVGLKALADPALQGLHVALLAERARRFESGQRSEANGHGG